MPVSECIQIGVTDEHLCVQIVGRGTLSSSPAFHQFCRSALEADREISLLVNLAPCNYLDSTFLGCLVGLHKTFPDRMTVAAEPEVSARLLSCTHLDKILRVDSATPQYQGPWADLPTSGWEKVATGRHAAECHRRLIECGCPGADAFQRVVDHLEEELGGQGSQ